MSQIVDLLKLIHRHTLHLMFDLSLNSEYVKTRRSVVATLLII